MPRICQTGLLSQITCQCLISDWLSDSWWTSDVLQKLNTALICLVRDDLIEFSVSSYLTRKEIESYNPFLLLFTRKDNVNSRDSGYAELMNYQYVCFLYCCQKETRVTISETWVTFFVVVFWLELVSNHREHPIKDQECVSQKHC